MDIRMTSENIGENTETLGREQVKEALTVV
jgi:hypothetical protein